MEVKESFSLNLRNQSLCVCLRTVEEGEEGLGVQVSTLVVYLGWGRSNLTHPLDPGTPVAPPPLQLLLLLSHLPPVKPYHTLTLFQRDQETQRSHSPLSAPHRLSHFPQSSPLHLQILLLPPPPHLPFPLNLQSPAVLGPWLYSFDVPGHEHARATPRLLHSSPEIRCCWSHSAAWPGSPGSGTETQVGTQVVRMC